MTLTRPFANPKVSCRHCGYESENCRSFTAHLGVHAESGGGGGGGGGGARSAATDVVCGGCGLGFSGRIEVGEFFGGIKQGSLAQQ